MPHEELCSLNTHSIKSKSADFINYVCSHKADLVAITETWLSVDDSAARYEITPPGYKFADQPRTRRTGGGTGLLYRDNIQVSKLEAGEKNSFEFSEWRIRTGRFRLRLVIRYRPPYSARHPVISRVFFTKFTEYLESIILSAEPICITGDYNIHVDTLSDPYATELMDLLESMGLEQHVNQPTHELGHTLDLIVTRQTL